jgi:signal transduction histidine kinase
MRRSLILTVAAAVSMVLLAMLVPMAVLLRSYALEDRLSRAALEVQTTESVVSGQEKGVVSGYLDRINRDDDIQTTVFYPDGQSVGPDPTEDERVAEARRTGQARVDDVEGGAEFLVPVSLGGSSVAAELTPVIQVRVLAPGLEAGIVRTWLALLALGATLLAGALLLADRLGRSFVQPIRALAAYAQQLGDRRRPDPVAADDGPPEVRDLAAAMHRLVTRVETLLERERAGVADVSHRLRTPITTLRLRVDSLGDPADRARLGADLDELQVVVDHVVREARRSEREGLAPRCDAATVLGERAGFWQPLAEDQGRVLDLQVAPGPLPVRAPEEDLTALLDVLLDNVFTHTPEGAGVWVTVEPRPGGGAVLTVDDGGDGYPQHLDVADRGTSGAGSTGLGLSIVGATATESGGGLSLSRSPHGGARAVVELGAP